MFGAANHRRTDHRVGKNCGVLHGLHGRFVCILDSLLCSEVTRGGVCVAQDDMCVCMFLYIQYAQAGCLYTFACLCIGEYYM